MSRIDFSHRTFFAKIRAMIEKENMLSYGDSVLIGLSGGADSVALFRIFLELQEEYSLTLSCAHINHGLRGQTAQRDMEFCKQLCRKFAIPIAVLEADVRGIAKEHRLSVEDAGRQVRYAFYKEQNSKKIAVAHTKDDNAETVLMNLVKGNLPLGIAPCRENIIRPLLCVTKEEIYTYLESLGQEYVTDETNFTTDYTRNKIRLELIPYIEEHFNKNFTNTVYHYSNVLYQERCFLEGLVDKIYHQAAKEENGAVILTVQELLSENEVLAKRAIRRAYYRSSPQGESISYEQLECVFRLCQDGKKGKQVSLPGNMIAQYTGDFLMIKQKEQSELEPVLLKVGASVTFVPSGEIISLEKTASEKARFCYPIRIKEGEQVTLRTRRDGDKLYFRNMNIHKKLSDFFIDKKIPLHERDRIPLICVDGSVRVVMGHFFEEVTQCPVREQYYVMIK